MTDTIETTLPPTTAGDLQSSAKLDERDLVAPPASDNLGTPAIKLSPLIRGMYESMRRMGVPVSDSYLQSGAVGAVTGNKSIADKHAARCTPLGGDTAADPSYTQSRDWRTLHQGQGDRRWTNSPSRRCQCVGRILGNLHVVSGCS
jgi:hypothetical protein